MKQITVNLPDEGVYLVGVVSEPGREITKENRTINGTKQMVDIEPKFRFRLAVGGDQLHAPVFYTVTFRNGTVEDVKKMEFLKKELQPVVVYGRLSSNPSSDGRKAYLELSGEAVSEWRKK